MSVWLVAAVTHGLNASQLLHRHRLIIASEEHPINSPAAKTVTRPPRVRSRVAAWSLILCLVAVEPATAQQNAVCAADRLPEMISGFFRLTTAIGCTGSGNPTGAGSNPIRAVSVADLHLVVEVREDANIDELTVVSPNGEAFATRSLSPGVRRETVEPGTSYTPGSYEIHASAGGETVGESTIDIRPDVRIVDLKLGRNHPDKMYEGASEQAIRSEVIVSLENQGTGPDAVTSLRFDGDVPFPTRENFEESGIYDTESNIDRNRERVLFGTGTEVTLFSNSRPFSPTGGNLSCEDGPVDGQFSVEITTQLSDNGSSTNYEVSYRGNDDFDCDITVARGTSRNRAYLEEELAVVRAGDRARNHTRT